MKRRIDLKKTEYYFDALEYQPASISCINYRNADFFIRASLDEKEIDLIVPENEKLSFVEFLKKIINEIEKDAMRQI